MSKHTVRQIWLLLLVAWPGMSPAATAETHCKTLFRRRAYADAAKCFEQHIPSRLSGLTKRQQVVVGRRIRNTAISYRRATLATSDLGKSSYYKERAVGLLQRYLKHRLYESKYRKTSAIVLLHGLQETLFYAPLTVLAAEKRARIAVIGFQFQVHAVQRWSGNVRPGTYQIIVDNGKQQQKLTVSVATRSPILLTIPKKQPSSRPQPTPQTTRKPRISPAAWWLLGLGGAVLIGGAVTLGLSLQEQGRMNQLIDEGPKDIDHTIAINQAKGSTNAFMTGSIICWALGGAMAIGGAVFLLAPTTRQRAPAAPPPSAAQTFATP